MGRKEGEDVSDGGWDEGADEGFWKSLAMSGLPSLRAADATETAGEEADELVLEAGTATDGLAERVDLPFTCVSASIVPKDLTLSDLIAGAAAGEEEMGAETSSIEPNVTAEPEWWAGLDAGEVEGKRHTLFCGAGVVFVDGDAILNGDT